MKSKKTKPARRAIKKLSGDPTDGLTKRNAVAGLLASSATRESWIGRFAQKLRPHFARAGAIIPDRVRYSCGFALGRRKIKVEAIEGQCFPPGVSNDNTTEIFISPLVDDPLRVAVTLVHELVHACGILNHGADFERLALAVGLLAPMRTTPASDALKATLGAIISKLGPYPHGRIVLPGPGSGAGGEGGDEPRGADQPKKQGTRMIKCECAKCGYTVRATRKWITVGAPLCPDGDELTPELPDDDQGDDDQGDE